MEEMVNPRGRARKGNRDWDERVKKCGRVCRIGEVKFGEKGVGDGVVKVVPGGVV